uniref:Uncharacterized protein n=1 Tax=Glycine max TaxID=3847 RepID=A0A0R0I7L5_SOYBN
MTARGSDPIRGRLWPQMALALAIAFISSTVVSVNADGYPYYFSSTTL